MSYLECFAEHAQVTYRYVPRRQWSSLVTRLYDDDESLLVDDASMALLLLVIGLGSVVPKPCYIQPPMLMIAVAYGIPHGRTRTSLCTELRRKLSQSR